jgi:uncharacterized integral membrane protein (TIGR00698 family)
MIIRKTQSQHIKLIKLILGQTNRQQHQLLLQRKQSTLTKLAPGLLVAFGTSQAGFAIAHEVGLGLLNIALAGPNVKVEITQSPISGIPVSIILGLAINNIILERFPKLTEQLKHGFTAATKPVLQTGIVCVGAKLSAIDLLTTGLVGIPCVAASVSAGLIFIPWFGTRMGLTPKMSSLIAAGTSICGVTAVTAVAPAIKADQKEASFAIANVVAFGTLGMLTMPYVAHYMLPTSQQVGLFLGLSVHDTSQVIGSALTYSSVFGDESVVKTAAVTKLTRNLLLAGVVPMMTIKHAAFEPDSKQGRFSFDMVKKYTPVFVIGFVGMSCLRTVGDITLAESGKAFLVLDKPSWTSLYNFVGGPLGSQYLLGTALAGVGLTTKLSALKGVGYKPFLVGFSGACVVGGTGLLTSSLIGLLL